MWRTGRTQICGVWKSPRREALGQEHKGPHGAHQPREGLGASVAKPPRKTARGPAGDDTGADLGAVGGQLGARRPGAGRHSQPCRSGRSQGNTGASPSGPGGPHTAPAAAPCWTDASAHASPRCLCTCPAAIRRDQVSTPRPAREGGRRCGPPRPPSPPEETGHVTTDPVRVNAPPRAPHRNQERAGRTTVCVRDARREATLSV